MKRPQSFGCFEFEGEAIDPHEEIDRSTVETEHESPEHESSDELKRSSSE
jgi:hypothetical protein